MQDYSDHKIKKVEEIQTKFNHAEIKTLMSIRKWSKKLFEIIFLIDDRRLDCYRDKI